MDPQLNASLKQLIVLFTAAMPVLELRAAIPLGISFGMKPLHVLLLGLLGSMVPVPLLLFFLRPVFAWMRKSTYWRRLVDWVTRRTLLKTSAKIKKYSVFGLALFVAIPLPTTGVWTGAIAASLLNIPFRAAFLAIFIGNCIAGWLIMMISHVAVTL